MSPNALILPCAARDGDRVEANMLAPGYVRLEVHEYDPGKNQNLSSTVYLNAEAARALMVWLGERLMAGRIKP